MQHITLFENFHQTISREEVASIAMHHDNHTIDNVTVFVNVLFSRLNEQDEVTLYRLLKVRKKKHIDIGNLGQHYVFDDYFSDDMLDTAGLTLTPEDYDRDLKLFKVTVCVPVKDINIKATISANLDYPGEQEVTLGSSVNVRVVSIDLFD